MKKLLLLPVLALAMMSFGSQPIEEKHDHTEDVGYTCPEDNWALWSTGDVRVNDYGKMFYGYRCSNSHFYWIAA